MAGPVVVILAAGQGTRMKSQVPKVLHDLKATTTSRRNRARMEHIQGAVFDHGAYEEHGPVTAEALSSTHSNGTESR